MVFLYYFLLFLLLHFFFTDIAVLFPKPYTNLIFTATHSTPASVRPLSRDRPSSSSLSSLLFPQNPPFFKAPSGPAPRSACSLASSLTTRSGWATCCWQASRISYGTGGTCSWRYHYQASCLFSTYGEDEENPHCTWHL